MKKTAITLLMAVAAVLAASAQKFALVDMEYIFKNVPSYEMANEQLNQLSQRWQKEVEAVGKEAETMYQNYLSDKVFLTEEQVKKREEEIVAKEKAATELRYKYFGPEAPDTSQTDTGRRIQRRQKSSRRTRLPDRFRPRVGFRHSVCLATHRHKQRSTCQIGLFQLIS